MRSWSSGRSSAPTRALTALAATAALLLGVTPASADTQTPALPDRFIDVVQVSWPNSSTPAATAASVAQVIQSDTIDRWRKISNGRIVFTFGKLLDPLQTRIQLPCDAAGSIDYMNAVQTSAYQRAGITKWDNRYLVILAPSPNPDCVWDGRGIVNPPSATSGRLILKNTDDRTVIAHELGHNLGFGHSNYEKCNDGRPDGPWTDCTAVEYGSATDLMGNNDRSSPLNAYHQWRAGWIANTDVAVGNKNISVTLNPVDTTTGTRAIFIRDKTAAYWVEYRKADPENQIDAGLVLYRSDPPPASAVDSPIASDKSDPTSTSVTTDVWMISLGSYRYTASRGSGSPSLAQGKLFTTAFGGASIIASENSDGTASVTVSRNTSTLAPSRPEFSDPETWRTPDALLLEPTLNDNGVAVSHFEARITINGNSRIEKVAVADSIDWTKTYLSPITAPANVKLGSLPEGTYELQLRAVNTLGTTGEWSQSTPIRIDAGAPTVTNAFTQSFTTINQPVSVAWTGATDKGSGICQVQLLNEDGFAVYKWVSDEPGTPVFTLAPQVSEQREAVVFDCLGNGVGGTVSLTTSTIPAARFARTGAWRTAAAGLRCTRNCTASLKTPPGTTSISLQGTGLRITIDGKSATPAQLRKVVGTRTVKITGSSITLSGAQTLTSGWTQTRTVAKRSFVADSSLASPTQLAFSEIGFSQSDFSDSFTVLPINGGTSTQQATLDLCGDDYPSETLRVARRQVIASRVPEKYVFLSTETVRYQSAAAVQQALREIDERVTKCKSDGYTLTSAGTKQPYEFLQLPGLPAGLVPESDRRIYLVNIGDSATATTLLAAYQFSGNMLNALYVVVDRPNSIAVSEQSRWLQVAATLAQRLRNAARTPAT